MAQHLGNCGSGMGASGDGSHKELIEFGIGGASVR